VGLRRLRPRGVLVAALFLAAAAQAGQGGWILVKAGVAQQLLDRAWRASVADGAPVRPWPWADTWPVARLSAPRLGADSVVLAGASGEALAFGPGLVPGSALPGGAGNTVIAGHRDTHFAFLEGLREQDRLVLDDATGRRAVYEVVGIDVVDERDTVIGLGTTESWLTLVACWPFDAIEPGGPWRYVVSARALRGSARAGGAEHARDQESQIGAEAVPEAPYEDGRQQEIHASEALRHGEGGGRAADVRL
jgi:sortase A